MSVLAVLVAMVCAQLGTGVSDASAPLVVPSSYPTIRSAVDAAAAGDTIKVRPGTYVEQVSIDKNLKITGSGSDSTTIRAPGTLVAGEDGGNSIVEIHGDTSVVMPRLAVSGPGGGTCEDGALGSGIRVLGAGHLNLSFARVTHISDTPVARASAARRGSSLETFLPVTRRRRFATHWSATIRAVGSWFWARGRPRRSPTTS